MPTRVRSTVTPAAVPPGAMSPLPVRVSLPAASRRPAGWWNFSQSVRSPSSPTSSYRQPPAGLTRSKTPVAWVNRACTMLPPRAFAVLVTLVGEATKSPICTVRGSPASRVVPTSAQVEPSAEAYPVTVSPVRVSRSHDAVAGPAWSCV